jgi:hypothetical protein
MPRHKGGARCTVNQSVPKLRREPEAAPPLPVLQSAHRYLVPAPGSALELFARLSSIKSLRDRVKLGRRTEAFFALSINLPSHWWETCQQMRAAANVGTCGIAFNRQEE